MNNVIKTLVGIVGATLVIKGWRGGSTNLLPEEFRQGNVNDKIDFVTELIFIAANTDTPMSRASEIIVDDEMKFKFTDNGKVTVNEMISILQLTPQTLTGLKTKTKNALGRAGNPDAVKSELRSKVSNLLSPLFLSTKDQRLLAQYNAKYGVSAPSAPQVGQSQSSSLGFSLAGTPAIPAQAGSQVGKGQTSSLGFSLGGTPAIRAQAGSQIGQSQSSSLGFSLGGTSPIQAETGAQVGQSQSSSLGFSLGGTQPIQAETGAQVGTTRTSGLGFSSVPTFEQFKKGK